MSERTNALLQLVCETYDNGRQTALNEVEIEWFEELNGIAHDVGKRAKPTLRRVNKDIFLNLHFVVVDGMWRISSSKCRKEEIG